MPAIVSSSIYVSGAESQIFLEPFCNHSQSELRPISGAVLLTGLLEPMTVPYTIAKTASLTMVEAYHVQSQYSSDFISVMPPNACVLSDSCHAIDNHAVAPLMPCHYQAKDQGAVEDMAGGASTSRREFLNIEGQTDENVYLFMTFSDCGVANIIAGREKAIRELAQSLGESTGNHGKLDFDTASTGAAPRGWLDIAGLAGCCWRDFSTLHDGLKLACANSQTNSLHGGRPGLGAAS